MASSSVQSPVAPSPNTRATQPSAHVAYIDAQLNQTRRQVKLVDLATAATMLAAGVLVYFLLLVVVDHWLMPLGTWGRFASLTVLLGGAGWYVATQMLPLLLRQINPVYAAHTIEQSQPTLKNSLLNFLLFRKNQGALKDVILRALEEQAASDLGHVEIETAVDRAPLIRIGYVLAGVLAVCAVYTVVSPKNPLTTVRRVMLPWADIQRPARVLIDEVKPGDRQVYHGQTLEVVARVRGVSASDAVHLFYSTADETTVDRRLTMEPLEGTSTFRAILPATEGGIQQDLTYHLEAGDAESPRYHVTVLPSPTITVEEVEYHFPAYTGKPEERQKHQGDLRALEGTRVTLHAVASQPIQEAYVEFDPPTSGAADAKVTTPRWSTKVHSDGKQATFAFTLSLQADRRTPAHSSYQLRFRTPEGNQNDQPILHAIEVLPDLPPEVQIVSPRELALGVPLNGRQAFEVRAFDPDFGLSALNAKVAGAGRSNDHNSLATEKLLTDAAKKPQQLTTTYALTPQQLNLKAGDEVLVWFEAADTRTLPSGTPEPNAARTKNVRVTILPPAEQPPQKENEPQPQNEPNPNQNPQNGEKKNDANQGGQPKSNDNKSQPPKENPENKGQQGEPQGEKKDNKDPSGGQGEQQPTPNNKPENKEGKQQGGGNNKKQSDQQQGANSSDKKNGGAGGAAGKQNSSEPNNGNEQGDASQAPGQPSPGGAQGQQKQTSSAGQGGQSADGAASPSGAKEQGEPNGESRPLNADGSQDADAIHEILKHKQEAQQGGESAKSKPGEQNAGEKGEQKTGAQGEQGAKPENNPAGDKGGAQADAKKPTPGGEKSTEKSQAGGQAKTGGKPGEQGPESKPGEAGAKPENAAGAEKKPEIKDANVADRKTGDAAGPKENTPGVKSGEPKGAQEAGKEESKASDGGEKKDAQGGMGDNGKSNGGPKGEDAGAPESQGDNRQSRNPPKPDDPKGEEKGEAQSPSTSKHQSNARGDQRGDQSGDGGKGGGQGAKQAGNDSAGSTSPGDDGNSAAKEQGNGETGSKAGTQKKSDERTGKGGNEKGNGSAGKPKPDQQPGEKPNKENQDGSEPGQGGKSGEQKSAGKTGAGKQSNEPPNADTIGGNFKGEIPSGQRSPATPNTQERQPPEAAQADVEYARKATDLALEYLKDQQDQPDPALLKKLGWTKEQLQDFLARWKNMKDAAGQAGDKGRDARDELDAALRSLGLRPAGDTLHAGTEKNDKLTGQRDTGGRTSPPSDYAEQYKAFLKGTARGEKRE